MSDRTQDLKNLRAVATACKNYVDETKEQILWQVGQYNITTQDDNTTAYQKTVPTGATRVKIKSIGGMSYKSENLVLEQKQIILNAGSEKWVNFVIYNLVVGETYTASIFTDSVSNEIWQNQTYSYRTITKANPHTFTATATSVTIRVGANNLNNNINYQSKLMLVKGSTAPTEFKVGYTGIRDSIVTSVKSYDSNNNLIDTYTIPSEIQALDGYGRGINENCYNVLNLDTKVFTDKDGVVDLGTLNNWSDGSSNPTYNVWWIRITDMKIDGFNAPCLCENYELDNTHSQARMANMSFYSDNGYINIKNTSCSSASELKTALNNVNFQYELATYNLTDNLVLPNNVIEVEEGGYLVFENQYGQAVPSNITYRIEVES